MNPLYLVEADYGRHGKAFVETDRDRNSWEAVIKDIADCQYTPVKILEVVEDEGTVRDRTEDAAIAVREWLHANDRPTPLSLIDWLGYHAPQHLEAAE